MNKAKNQNISEYVKVFKGRPLPAEALLSGYSALIRKYNLQVPTPCVFRRKLPPIPEQTCHPFRFKPAARSG